MRVLLAAYACEPHRGSEEGFGWNWATHLASQGHDVWVMTRPLARSAIERAMTEAPMPNLHFVYVDIPSRYRRFIKGLFGVYAHYFLWQRSAYREAKSVIGRQEIDLVHHVTWGSLIGGSWLWKLGKPFVFGPVGGGQVAPAAFSRYFPTRWREESLRTYITVKWLPYLPSTRRMLRHTTLLLATNSETLAIARQMGAPRAELFLDTGLPATYYAAEPKYHFRDHTAHILWVGRLLERKALLLSLEAVARLKIPFSMTILGDGPQDADVNGWIESLGLTGRVHAPGRVAWSEVQRAYEENEIFLFTSLRDSFGSQLLEAMSNGLAIVTLDHQGAHDFVPDEAGLKVPVTTPEETAERLADAIAALYRQPERLAGMSAAGLAFARTNEWTLKAKQVTRLYDTITPQTPRREPVY
ncbi:MAG: glycosyltransferase family 4 protein [Rhodothermales bacterium]|nr:glycosyltransferase family 4 protein [Rhodothermales bacterium]